MRDPALCTEPDSVNIKRADHLRRHPVFEFDRTPLLAHCSNAQLIELEVMPDQGCDS